jgi:DNA-binding response OmpR family regulator
MTTILVVEDDPKTAELVQLYLERDGHRVLKAADGRAGLDLALTEAPDLVVLDLMLPKLDGLTLCQELRRRGSTPVILLTARATEDDMLHGLEQGADDYLTKPFSPRELAARVRAVLRRSAQPASAASAGALAVGELAIDLVRRTVTMAGRPVALTPREFRLLATLARSPGRAFSRQELVDHVCGADYDGLDRTLDVHVMNLRRKIELDPARPTAIQTVFGVGYKLAEPPHAA